MKRCIGNRGKSALAVLLALVAAVSCCLAGCTSTTTCSLCGKEGTEKVYNMHDPEDVEYFCDSHLRKCLVCQIYYPPTADYAVKFEVLTGRIYYCAIHDSGDYSVSGGIVG